MALTINTNISSLIAQSNLNKATDALNLSIERMTTGFKINHAKDNAAGYSIANLWNTQLGSLDVASDNAATGLDMLTTTEESYALLTSHLQRVRDLTAQASNGTYGTASLKAIQSEIEARLLEITRIANNSEFILNSCLMSPSKYFISIDNVLFNKFPIEFARWALTFSLKSSSE